MTPKQLKTEKEDLVRLSVRVPESVYEKVEQSAREHKRSVNLEIVTALRERYR